MALSLFWTFASETLGVADYSVGDTTAENYTGPGTASLDAAAARVGSAGGLFDAGSEQYRFDPTLLTIAGSGSIGFWIRWMGALFNGEVFRLQGSAYWSNVTINISGTDLQLRHNNDGLDGGLTPAVLNLGLTGSEVLQAGAWYWVDASWDTNLRRIRMRDALGNLVRETISSAAYTLPLTLSSRLVVGDASGQGGTKHIDNLFIGKAYADADTFAENLLISSIQEYPLLFIAAAHSDAASDSTRTVNKPTGTIDNDLMIALVKRNLPDEPTVVPTGWTLIGSRIIGGGVTCSWLYYRVASSEGASYTWTFPTLTRYGVTICTYRGQFNRTAPIGVVSNTSYGTSDNTMRAASMLVPGSRKPIIFCGGVHSSTTQSFTPPTTPAQFIEDLEFYDGASRWPRIFARLNWSGSGVTGNMDAVFTGVAIGAEKHAFAFEVAQPVQHVAVLQRRRFSHKPPTPSLLNRAHPLARNLVAAYLFNEGGGGIRNLAAPYFNQHTALGTGNARVMTPHGAGVSFDGTNNAILKVGTSALFTSKVSGFLIFKATSSAGGILAQTGASDAGGVAFNVLYEFGAYRVVSAGGGSSLYVGSLNTEWRKLAFSLDTQGTTGALRVFLDGVQYVGDVSPAGNFTNTTGQLLFGAYGHNNYVMTGQLAAALVWNRVLSDSEMRALTAEPYQFIEPERRKVFAIPPATGGGADTSVSGSASFALTASGALSTAITMAATAPLSLTASAGLSTAIRMAGNAPLSLSASGALTTGIALAGNAPLSLNASAALSTAIRMAAAEAFSLNGAADLIAGSTMAGNAPLALTAAGALSTSIALQGSASLALNASGALTTAIRMQGASTLALNASGELAGNAAQLAAAVSLSLAASGALSTGIALAGSATFTLSTSGQLTTAIRLQGVAPLTLSAAAFLSTGFQNAQDVPVSLRVSVEAHVTIAAASLCEVRLKCS